MKIYLSGTVPSSFWSDNFESSPQLKYYVPVSSTGSVSELEKNKKEWEECDYCLHLVTPKMKGFQEVVDLVDDSNKRSDKTLYCFLVENGEDKFSEHQIKSLNAIGKMVNTNGGKWLKDIEEVKSFLNKQIKNY